MVKPLTGDNTCLQYVKNDSKRGMKRIIDCHTLYFKVIAVKISIQKKLIRPTWLVHQTLLAFQIGSGSYFVYKDFSFILASRNGSP